MPFPVPSWFGFERSWLARGLSALDKNEAILLRANVADAQYELGLGNQQVYALEFWLRNLELIGKTTVGHTLTEWAQMIREYDSRFEDPSTWFAVHYRLSSSRDGAFAYWASVNLLPRTFTRSNLIEILQREDPGKSESTYFNHTRAFFAVVRGTPIGQSLNLFSITDDLVSSEQFDGSMIPLPVIAFAFLDWANKLDRKTFWIGEVFDPNKPGQQLLLTQEQLSAALEQIQERYARRVLWVSRTAGLDSVSFGEECLAHPMALLRACYLERLEGFEPDKALEASLEVEKARG